MLKTWIVFNRLNVGYSGEVFSEGGAETWDYKLNCLPEWGGGVFRVSGISYLVTPNIRLLISP